MIRPGLFATDLPATRGIDKPAETWYTTNIDMKSTYKASHKVRETLLLPYDPVKERLLLARGEDSPDGILSDKLAAQMCGVSERQVRNARLSGMNPYLADHMCIKGLGLHPASVFGDLWLPAEAFFASEIHEQRMTSKDAEDLLAFKDLGVEEDVA
jgi:hypothetical protein